MSDQPKKPYHKPTVKDQEARVDELVSILSTRPGVSRFKLHAILCPKWGVHFKTVDRYLGHAREELLKRIRISKEDFRAQAVAFYQSIIADKTNPAAVRLKAQRCLCELLGLNDATKFEVTGADGGPMEQETKLYLDSLSVDELKAAVGKLEQVGRN